MRDVFAALPIVAAVVSLGISAAEGPKPPPQPLQPVQPAPVEKLEKWEPTPAWLAAVERLRINPKPGEIENGGLTTGVTEVFELFPAEAQSIEKIVADYDAELVKKAAKWEEELKSTRAEYEAKVIAALPEAKRDAAKKLLDFSHAKWTPPLEREQKFKAAFVEHEKEMREKIKGKSPEEANDEREVLRAWVKEERARINKDDENLIAALKALLSPEEAQRLDRYNRHRVVPQAPAPAPTPTPLMPPKAQP